MVGLEQVLERLAIDDLKLADVAKHEVFVSAHRLMHGFWVTFKLALSHPEKLCLPFLSLHSRQSAKRMHIIFSFSNKLINFSPWWRPIELVLHSH